MDDARNGRTDRSLIQATLAASIVFIQPDQETMYHDAVCSNIFTLLLLPCFNLCFGKKRKFKAHFQIWHTEN